MTENDPLVRDRLRRDEQRRAAANRASDAARRSTQPLSLPPIAERQRLLLPAVLAVAPAGAAAGDASNRTAGGLPVWEVHGDVTSLWAIVCPDPGLAHGADRELIAGVRVFVGLTEERALLKAQGWTGVRVVNPNQPNRSRGPTLR